MRIREVKATTHRIEVQVPLMRDALLREIVFTRVETDVGIAGYGLSAQTLRYSVREFVNRELGPFLIDRDPLDTERLSNDMYRRFNQRGYSGVVQTAISAVDIALWDIKGKHLQLPVWRLLGGFSASVPAYVTFGLPELDRDQLVEFAGKLTSEGQNTLKMVVGASSGRRLAEDVARVRAVREAIGDEPQLMVDANQLLDSAQARELCRLIEPYDIAWFEEPIYANDARALAQLRTHTRIPIAAGQNEGHRWRHAELMLAKAIDIVQPNVLFVGGFTEGLKVAHMAQAMSMPVANGGGWPHHNAHLQASILNGHQVEYHYPTWMVGEAIFQDPPTVENGSVTLTDRPGLALEPRVEVLRETMES